MCTFVFSKTNNYLHLLSMKISLAILATIFIISFFFQQYKIHSLHKELDKLEMIQAKQMEINQPFIRLEKEHYELAITMARMQNYTQKLYFAGQNENWKLAQFYTHELEEAMEDIIDHKVTDEGKDISSLVKKMAFPKIKKIENAITAQNEVDFVEGYQLLLRACNNCHVASNHEFIKIITPKNEAFINQDFKK